jgi:hypothetical protein
VSLLCFTLKANGQLLSSNVALATDCVGGWLAVPADMVTTASAAAYDTLIKTLSDYFAVDPVMMAELSAAYFVLWITGYGVGRVVKSMGYV